MTFMTVSVVLVFGKSNGRHLTGLQGCRAVVTHLILSVVVDQIYLEYWVRELTTFGRCGIRRGVVKRISKDHVLGRRF